MARRGPAVQAAGRVLVLASALLCSVSALHVEPSGMGLPGSPSSRLGPSLRTADSLRLRGAGPKKTPTKVKVTTLKDSKKNPVEEWWYGYPFVTRWWFALCIITTAISWDKLPVNVPAQNLMLYWPSVIRLQPWRMLTTFTYFGSVGHNMLMEAVFMLNYSKSMEVTYAGARAKYLWHLIVLSIALMIVNSLVGMLGVGMDIVGAAMANVCDILGLLASFLPLPSDAPLQTETGERIPGIPFLAQPLLYSIVWIWARQNPETRMSVFGFFTVPAVYFPWFLLAYHCIMGGGLNIFYLLGFVVGHIFFFFSTLFPATKDSEFWEPPPYLLLQLPKETGFVGGDMSGVTVTDGADKGDGGEDGGKAAPKGPTAFSGKGRALGKK